MKNPLLRACGISFSYRSGFGLKDIDFEVFPGSFMAILGPNGSGKTTLLKILLGLLRPQSGRVLLGDQDLHTLPLKVRAKQMAYVSQSPFFTFPLTVREFVALGRYPHLNVKGCSKENKQFVEESLRLVDASKLAQRKFTTLSGGERQKVLIARALAQSRTLLLLDEPTVHLDLAVQVSILQMLKALCRERGLTVLAVLHDINLVSLFSDQVLLLNNGKPFGFGSKEEVLTQEKIQEVFQIPMKAWKDKTSGYIYFTPPGSL